MFTNIMFFWICDFSTGSYVIKKKLQWKYDCGHGKRNLASSMMDDLEVLK